MKRFFVLRSLLLLCIIPHSVLGFIPPNIEGFTHIECTLRPVSRPSEKRLTRPHIPLFDDASSLNWSGYIAATSLTSPTVDSVTAISGYWVIPAVAASCGSNTYSSIWVGIDGYTSPTVEQIGTEQDWSNGEQQNYAWFEMYPNASFEIVGFPTNVGDLISGLIQYIGSGIFVLTISNHTQQVTYTVPAQNTISLTAQRSSAEWIVEAPSLNGVLPLANFGTVNLSSCVAVIGSNIGAINSTNWQNTSLTMVTSDNVTKALPSDLSSNGENFSVTWMHS
jgi:hypothetical protein